MIPGAKEKQIKELSNAINYLENPSYHPIKANINGYETPKSFNKRGSDNPIINPTESGREVPK